MKQLLLATLLVAVSSLFAAAQSEEPARPTYTPDGSSAMTIDRGQIVTINKPDSAVSIYWRAGSTYEEMSVEQWNTSLTDVEYSTDYLEHGAMLYMQAYAAYSTTRSDRASAMYYINDPEHRYSINLAHDGDSTCSLSVEPLEAMAGETVRLTVVPGEEFTIMKVEAFDPYGLNAVEVTPGSTSGEYTFVQPRFDVSVLVSFRPREKDPQEGKSTTYTFTIGTDKGNNTAATEADSMTKGPVTVTTSKGAFGVTGSSANYRFGANSNNTFTTDQGVITKIVLHCTATVSASQYGPNQFSTSTGYYDCDGKTGTWTGEEQCVAFTALKQLRATQIDVTVFVPGEKGDVNGDGEVTVGDVSAVYDIILGLSEEFKDEADVNGDGEVTVGDVSEIYNIILGA